MFVGRDGELAHIETVLETARGGNGAALCLLGDPGIGKTTLLDAARSTASDFLPLTTTGVEAEVRLAHAGLLDVVRPLEAYLPEIPGPQRDALEAALGWAASADADAGERRYLVAAGFMSVLAVAAARRPVLVVADDLQWVDEESRAALAFAARRLQHDPVAFLLAGRSMAGDDSWAGVPRRRLDGLRAGPARELLAGIVAEPVVDGLVRLTSGNPLALTELAQAMTPEQRRGSAPLPAALPLGDRLTTAFERSLRGLSAPGRRAVVLAAASADAWLAPITGALRVEGFDPDVALAEAEGAGVLVVGPGTVEFRHPLLRAVGWSTATGSERRSAHRSLAAALGGDPRRQVRHLSEATTGFDDDLAGQLLEQSRRERTRHGYATASALAERAAGLSSVEERAADCRADAVEDAFVAGNAARVRELAGPVLDGPPRGQARGRVLLVLGTLEEYAGSVPRARTLLEEAAAAGSGLVRLRALHELAVVSYRLVEPEAMSAVARTAVAEAVMGDPEQEMLACFTQGAAMAFEGRWQEARLPMARAFDLLESDPALRDDPRYLATALLAPGWLGELERAVPVVDRRLDAARAVGALGVLPLALSLIAGGAMWLGQHQLAYAYAGEAVELGTEMGYVGDVAISYELLSWQAAARGLHDQAAAALAAARRLGDVAGVSQAAVQVELVDAFGALCRGDLPRVVDVLRRRIEVDGGRLPRGDYPLSVAPDLVEAYLGLGQDRQAVELAHQHIEMHEHSADPDIRGHAERLRGLVAVDEATADAAFLAAHRAHEAGQIPFDAARTRLLDGARLRRSGRRRAAREQLSAAAAAFASLGLDGWTMRAHAELAATGEKLRRGPREGDQLSSQETRVALLVARGMSNREIAAALFLSPKTVEHHLSSALRKRGLRSRTELAVAVARA